MTMTVNELLQAANAELDFYEVMMVDKALGEDGNYVEASPAGYGLINKVTGVIEHTSTILPGVLWQATHFESTLKSLLEPEKTADTTATEGDVVPFLPH